MDRSMLKIKLASAEEVANSREIWNGLVSSMRLPSVFLTWEWVTCWLEHYGKTHLPLIIFIYEGRDLRAIIPLVRKHTRVPDGFLKVKAISFCGNYVLCPDHLDIICAEGKAYMYIDMMINYFLNTYKDWNVLHLSFLAENGNIDKWIQLNRHNHRIKLSGQTVAPYISTEGDFNSYCKRFNSKSRYNLKKREKNLFETKGVTFHRIETQEELEKGIEDLFNLHEKRADEKGIKSTFVGDEVLDFHRDISKTFLEKGWLRFYFLKNGDKAISAVYGFVFERKFYHYQTGLDPEWQKFGPGNIINFKILEEIFNDEIVEFDFLGGDEGYKSFWTNDYKTIKTYNIYKKNIVGIIEKTASRLIISLKSLRRFMLNRIIPVK